MLKAEGKENIERIISKIMNINYMDINNGSKSRRFKISYKNLIKKLLLNTSYIILGWKNSRRNMLCYIKDNYTNRLFCISIPDITVDNEAWLNNINYVPVDNIYEIPSFTTNRCKAKDLVTALDWLNIYYNRDYRVMADTLRF